LKASASTVRQVQRALEGYGKTVVELAGISDEGMDALRNSSQMEVVNGLTPALKKRYDIARRQLLQHTQKVVQAMTALPEHELFSGLKEGFQTMVETGRKWDGRNRR
jgi:hypothetical protein